MAPGRLQLTMALAGDLGLLTGDQVRFSPPAMASDETLRLVHEPDYVAAVLGAGWRGLDDLEMATVEYIDWYNNRRVHGEIGHIPPAEHEALHAMTHPVTAPLKTS